MIQTLNTIIVKYKKFSPEITPSIIYLQEYLCEFGIKATFIAQNCDILVPKLCGL